MNNMLVVKILKRTKSFIDYILNDIFSEGLIETCFKYVSETTWVQILNEDPKPIFEVVSIMILYNVLMITNRHESYFISNWILLLKIHSLRSLWLFVICLLIKPFQLIDELQSIKTMVWFFLNQIYFSIPSSANLLHNVIVKSWII